MDGNIKKPGLPPGTLVHHGKRRAEDIRIKVIDYSGTHINEIDISEINTLTEYRNAESVSWIVVEGLHDTDKIGRIGSVFGLHPLVIEDVLHPRQRTKVETYDEYIYVVLQATSANASLIVDRDEWTFEQLSMILGDGYVLTFHEHSMDIFNPVIERLQTSKGRLRSMQAGYLFYALFDLVVDLYWVLVNQLENRIDDVEERLFNHNIEITLGEIHELKKNVIRLHRPIGSLNRVCESIIHSDFDLFDESVDVYFRDVHDHTLRTLETNERHRESLTSLLEIQMTITSNRMNEVMKTLTVISTVFIPLTFVAGIYGMNFNPERSRWNMPELNWPFGYPLAWGMMITFACGMVIYFKRKKWL